ncbi:MAG TPA: 50S ribosomal protein L13 [Acidobacteriota bacterium]|nr:50S ribosomal protein L13 [Acidobacteriota bacterium]
MKSFIPRERDIQKQWHVIDAEGQILGRLASKAARLLTGKDKPIYTPFLDTGDHVIIINAEKVKLTGKKLDEKMYRHHTGFPGGLKETAAGVLLSKEPGKLVREAVIGMLPKTKLGRAMRKKLKVYAGPQHPHQAQQPTPLSL